MNYKISLLFLLFNFCAFSQKFDARYTQFEFSMPFKSNGLYGSTNSDGSRNDYLFIPDGLSAKIGYGIHYEENISFGLHSGIDWKINEKLVVAPIFLNTRLNLEVGQGAIALQFGWGKALAIGRGNLSGTYRRFNIGYKNDDDLTLFADLSLYNFAISGYKDFGTISIGINKIIFY
ncbi:hypothetical protein ABF176_002192 [Flavobacterium psychrophilum]|uniref:hypothetical protein n=1 Tax=Flavobacterium psychrophilum TaxID=96345 RepID=UPI000B7C2B48|nr:hypothetical protein [Flavobacterium psychrophilum]EKT4552565.1 hypothetical protein [Flavobacterium psychrophilum]SNB39375.1 conserved exported hypothetical protein [Flavobacterium psychrophilum]